MSEPREWWIFVPIDLIGRKKGPSDFRAIPLDPNQMYNNFIKDAADGKLCIEKSAYDALKAENERIKYMGTFKERDELVAKIARLEKTWNEGHRLLVEAYTSGELQGKLHWIRWLDQVAEFFSSQQESGELK